MFPQEEVTWSHLESIPGIPNLGYQLDIPGEKGTSAEALPGSD